MTLTPEAREAGAKACYESWIGGVEEAEPAWADLPESHRERMRASFEAGASALAVAPPAMPLDSGADDIDYGYSLGVKEYAAAIGALKPEREVGQ